MSSMRIHRLALLAGIAATAAPALAQPAPVAPTTTARRTFVPADFARFAPRTAYDMLVQLPGFTIRTAVEERGLGQASENVLINGERIANKSGGAVAELQRISASNVERIEIAEAAQLGIAGLSGQVANIVVSNGAKSTGQFEWRPEVRAHYATPNWYRGSVSYNGKSGPVDWTLSLENQASRGAYGGPAEIRDGDGSVFERRSLNLHSDFDQPKLTGKFKLDGPGSSLGNLSLAWRPYFYDFENDERRERADGDDRDRRVTQTQKGYSTDFNGDYELGLGPGRLKLIGLRHFEHEPTVTRQITRFDSGAADQGIKFDRDVEIGETIGRAEYRWKLLGSDWQASVERADNRLDQVGRFFELDPAGEFVEVPFPQGSGSVAERRYEGLLTFGRALSPKLDLQLVGGGEISRLERVDGDAPARKFFRPKGSLSLAWRPAQGWDASFKLNRKVGQISFYDFLAQPRLQDERENAGNPDLVPPQSWQAEVEAGRDLGAWGKTRLRLYAHRIDDIVDIIPIGLDGEGIGNLPRATRLGFESKSTIQFEPMGWKGAKLDLTVMMERSRVADPLTGEKRAISDSLDRNISLTLRHDIPGSKLAWGISGSHAHYTRAFYPTEIAQVNEGPAFVNAYVEHKDVAGLTVRATAGNIFNARHLFKRTVFAGRRNVSPVSFVEDYDQLIGPIFSLLVRGNF